MKNLFLSLSLCLCLCLGLSPGVRAASPEQAKTMVEKAADYLRRFGPEKAFAAINDQDGPFHDGDLYVFVHDTTGLIRAHGGFPSYIGKNTIWASDRDGVEFVKAITQIQDSGWIDYKWLNPITKRTEQKTVYVLRVGDLLICSGAYLDR